MLEKEFQYFLANQKELVKKHEGKFLMILSDEVVGIFENTIEAYKYAKEKLIDGFLIQRCSAALLARQTLLLR
jgi:hypothetical protein